MKSLQHHVKKLAKLMQKADKLLDPTKAAKLIKKAEKRAEKIDRRCHPTKKENDSLDG